MSATSAEKPRLVITGADGAVAAACEKQLRPDFDVTALRRGDDLVRFVEQARVVVALDGANPSASPADYRLALQAIGHALRLGSVEQVITVTLCPARLKRRKAFLGEAQKAERALQGLARVCTVIRCRLIVGTPAFDGPLDSALFADSGTLVVPGSGEQRVAPLAIDDLGAVVAAAARGDPTRDRKIELDGPIVHGLGEVLTKLNPDAELVSPGPGRTSSPLLPKRDFLGSPNPAASCLRVQLQDIESVWTANRLAQRRERQELKKSAWRYRVREWSSWVSLVLTLLALGAAVIGVHDLIHLYTLGPRLAALSALLFAGVALFGAVSLWTAWPARYEFAFLACLLAAVVLTSFTIAAYLVNGDPPAAAIAPPLLLAAVLAALIKVWQQASLSLTAFFRTRGVKIFGSLVLAGATVSFLQFIYASVYVPTTATPALIAEASIEQGPQTGRLVPTSFDVTLKNPTKFPVNVLGTYYTVDATRQRPVRGPLLDRKLGAEHERQEERALLRTQRIRAWGLPGRSAPVERGELVEAGTFFEPGEELHKRFVAEAGLRANTAVLNVYLVVARRRFDSELAAFTPNVLPRKGPVVIETQPIDDRSWLHAFTRSNRYIHVVEDLRGTPLNGCLGRMPLGVYVDDEESVDIKHGGCSELARRLSDFYGLTTTHTTVELPLAHTAGAGT
jgi:hypothetical protein